MSASFDIRISAFGNCRVPPKDNANIAWPRKHSGFIHQLAPHGTTGFVIADGKMSSNQSGKGDIRRALIEADRLDCMVAFACLPFYSTQTPATFQKAA